MSGVHRRTPKRRRRTALGQVLVVLALAIGVLPLLSGSTLAVASDVTFSKSGPATVDQGGTVTYTISASNSANDVSEPVTVADHVGVALSNVQASASQGSCTVNGNAVSCSLGTIPAGGSATVTISATAPTASCPTILNRASVQVGTESPRNTNTVTTDVTGCEPDLTFSKSGPATVDQGGTVTYTIAVSNESDVQSRPRAVIVTDSVDASLTNVQASASQGSCDVNGNAVSCALGTISAGATATVTITATAPSDSCPVISNTANVQMGTKPAQSTNTVTTQVTGCESDLTFSKSGPATVDQGGTVTYTIGVQNSGTVDSQPVTVTDTVDASLTNVQASASQGSCDVNGHAVSCALGPIAAGGSATVTITATAPTGSCPEISNAAEVQQGTQPPQSTNTVTTTVTGCDTPNVQITKSASTATVAVGGSFSYTVVASNTGNGPAQNVVVTDSIPTGLTITNVTGPGCSVNGQNVTCNVGTLAAGASATITITVTATASACPSVTNTAHVTWAAGEGTASADSNQVAVAVACTPGISLTKSASTATVAVGGSFSYTVVASNTGNGPAQNVVVTDSIPTGLTITNVTGPGCSVNGQNVTCNVGTLAAGASATITITVTATASACPSVTNTAHVTFDNGQGGTGTANSNAIAVGVNCQPDVQIVKNSDAPGRGIDSGESFSYTITVANDGNATAEGIIVTDTIPSGLTIDGVTGPGCSVRGQVVTCNVGDLAAGASVTITIDVTATDEACPEVENFAHVEWIEGEETVSEDSNTVHTDVDCVGGETVTPTTPPPTATTTTPPGGTAFTGPDEGAVRLGVLAIALLVLGTGLLFAGYRRRARSES